MARAEKIKVYNDNKYAIGGYFADTGFPWVALPGSFVLLTEEDIEKTSTISTLFTSHKLRIEEAKKEVAEYIGVDDNSINNITNEEIRTKLTASADAIRKWLAPLTENHVLARVYEVAQTMDLNTSKVKAIQEKNPAFQTKDDLEEAKKIEAENKAAAKDVRK